MSATEVHGGAHAPPSSRLGRRAAARCSYVRAVPRRCARRHLRRRLLRGRRRRRRGDARRSPRASSTALDEARLHRGRQEGRRAARRRPGGRSPTPPPAASSSRRTRSRTRPPAGTAPLDPLDRPRGLQRRRRRRRQDGRGVPRGHGRGRRRLVLGPRPLRHRPRLRPQLHRVPPLRRRRQRSSRRSTTTTRSRHVLRARAARTRGRCSSSASPTSTLQVDLSNAGNVRLAGARPRQRVRRQAHQLGAREVRHAGSRPASSGQLADGRAPRARQRYRVLAFYGCSTNSYDKALRDTEGFSTKQADILRHQPRHRAAARTSPPSCPSSTASSTRPRPRSMLGGVNTAMRKHEHGFARRSLAVHRTQGQRGTLTERTRGFARQGPPVLRSGEATDPARWPRKHQQKDTFRE